MMHQSPITRQYSSQSYSPTTPMSYGAHSQHSHVRQVSTPGVNQKYQPAHSTRAETWSNQTQMPYDSATVTTYECAPTYVMDGHNFHDYWARACKADRDYI